MNAICYMNEDGVVVLFAGVGEISTLYVAFKLA